MSAPPLLSKLPVDHWFDASYLEEQGVLPLEIAGDRLRIAVAGEPTSKVLQDLERSYGMPVDLVRVSEADLLKGIHQPAIRSCNTVMSARSSPSGRPSIRTATCQDRKSTRLNSSHSQISYAVFCLKKKKNK